MTMSDRAGDAVEVLVVEDEVLILMLLQELLESAGLKVATAPDAEAAFRALCGPAARASVLVTDLNLGGGPDGIAVAAAARRRLPCLRIVFATGNPELLTGHPLAPGDQVFAKPFDAAAFTEAVRRLVRRKAGPDHDSSPAA